MSKQCFRMFMLFLSVGFCTNLTAQTVCSIETIAGFWAASSQGTIFPTPNPPPISGPGAAVGLVSIASNGHISINLTSTGGGGVLPVIAEGQVTVNPDCTGTLYAVTTFGWSMSEKIVILDSGNEVRTIAVGGFLRGKPTVWQCRWKRLSRSPKPMAEGISACSAHMTRGTWVGEYTGYALIPGQAAPVPTGIQTMATVTDYQKKLEGSSTASVGGQILSAQFVGSVVEVKPDCTGTLAYKSTVKMPDGSTATGEGAELFVIVDQGNEIWSLPVKGPLGMPIGLTRYYRTSSASF